MALMVAENAGMTTGKLSPTATRCVTVEVSTGFRHLFLLPTDASGVQLLRRIEAEIGVPYRCSRAVLCDGALRAKFTDLVDGRKTLTHIPSYLNLCFSLRGGGEGDEDKPPAKKTHWEEQQQQEEEEEEEAEEEDTESSSSSTNSSDMDTNVRRLFAANGYQSGPHSGYQSGSSSSGYPENFSSPSLESNSASSEEESSPQASCRTPSPPSLDAEGMSSESSDGNSSAGPPGKKSAGETLRKTILSNGLSDSGLSTIGTSDLEEEPNLPTDPMKWSCEDVLSWLDIMTKRVGLSDVDKRFFSMSGIGVAFIPRHGFVRRLGSKGVLFYQDFHDRLRAVHRAAQT